MSRQYNGDSRAIISSKKRKQTILQNYLGRMFSGTQRQWSHCIVVYRYRVCLLVCIHSLHVCIRLVCEILLLDRCGRFPCQPSCDCLDKNNPDIHGIHNCSRCARHHTHPTTRHSCSDSSTPVLKIYMHTTTTFSSKRMSRNK